MRLYELLKEMYDEDDFNKVFGICPTCKQKKSKCQCELDEGVSMYGAEGKPEWFDRAVALKKANPNISFVDISKEVGGLKAKAGPANIAYWLTGKDSGSVQRLKRSNFPFKPSDFEIGYKQGEMPEWYDRAVQMKLNNPNASFRDIATAIGGKMNKRNILLNMSKK